MMADITDAMVEAFQIGYARVVGAGAPHDGAIRAGLAAVEAHREPTERERALLEVLRNWEATPGNHRDAVWWQNWEADRRKALAAYDSDEPAPTT